MTRNRKFILVGIAAAVVGLATAGAFAHRAKHHWGNKHHGYSRIGGLMGLAGYRGPRFRKICRGDGAEMTDHMMVRIEHKVKLTEAQRPAFDELKTAARTAAEKLQSACPKAPTVTDQKGRAVVSPIERLTHAETSLMATLDALKIVRPAAEKFYAVLDDKQKAKLNKRRSRRWARHWKRRHKNSTPPTTTPQNTTPPATTTE
jgi:LTXXQ motif family protein